MRVGQYEYVEDSTHPDRLVLVQRPASPVRVRTDESLQWVMQKKAQLAELSEVKLIKLIKRPAQRMEAIVNLRTADDVLQMVYRDYHLDTPAHFVGLTAAQLDAAFDKSAKKARAQWTLEALEPVITPKQLKVLRLIGVFPRAPAPAPAPAPTLARATDEDRFRILMYAHDTGAFSKRTEYELLTMLPVTIKLDLESKLKTLVAKTFYAREMELVAEQNERLAANPQSKEPKFPDVVTDKARNMALEKESNAEFAARWRSEVEAARRLWEEVPLANLVKQGMSFRDAVLSIKVGPL